MKNVKKILGTVLLVLALVVSGCGRPTDGNANSVSGSENPGKYTIRVAHLIKEEQAGHLAFLEFKKKVEERSKGQIEVQLFPNASLYGSDREAIEAVQLGNIEMTATVLAPVASFNPKFMVFDLPFLFKTREAAYKALDGELGQALMKDLENNSFKGLGFAENGFRHMSNNNGPIETPDDLKGIKFRTLESPLHTDTFKSFGANASPFAFGELYTALQQKTYDAMEAPISLYYNNKFYEVQKYLTLTGHVYAAGVFLMNLDFFNKLPEDLQKVVTDASKEMIAEQRKLSQEEEKQLFAKLQETGMKINELTEEQKDAFREKAKPVYEKYTPQIGEDLVKQALEAAK